MRLEGMIHELCFTLYLLVPQMGSERSSQAAQVVPGVCLAYHKGTRVMVIVRQ